MSKELEACFKEIYHEIEYVYDSKVCSKANKNWSNDIKHYDNIRGNVLTIQRYLESIDNANPSEALECLKEIEQKLECCINGGLVLLKDDEIKINTIKQALIKAQEPKQYLKWEDLDFTRERQFIKVKLNNTEYILKYYVSVLKEEMIEILGADKSFITGLSHTCNNDKHFFNDLHLERVEE